MHDMYPTCIAAMLCGQHAMCCCNFQIAKCPGATLQQVVSAALDYNTPVHQFPRFTSHVFSCPFLAPTRWIDGLLASMIGIDIDINSKQHSTAGPHT